jgi:hypothetical protein
MPRHLRFIPPMSVVEVTTRTLQGRLLLTPSPATNDAVLGILGRAQHLTGMNIHYVAVMSNHIHLLLRPKDAAHLARFMAMVNANIAREAGRLVGWEDKFWGRRYQAIVVSDEPEAQLSRLRYLLAQGVKEGLVAHPLDWPGVTAARALVEGAPMAGTWVDRTGIFEARRRRKVGDQEIDLCSFHKIYDVAISPLPCVEHLLDAQRRELVAGLIDEIAEASRSARQIAGEGVAGRETVLKKNPHETTRLAKSPPPFVHAFCREMRRRFRQAYSEYLAAFRSAAALLRDGLRAAFPEGSFPPALPFVRHKALSTSLST